MLPVKLRLLLASLSMWLLSLWVLAGGAGIVAGAAVSVARASDNVFGTAVGVARILVVQLGLRLV